MMQIFRWFVALALLPLLVACGGGGGDCKSGLGILAGGCDSDTNNTAANVPPVAHAGANQSVLVGAAVTLDGSASADANKDALTFAWDFAFVPSGSTAVLASPTSAKPTFMPDVPGVYAVRLVVNDGQVSSGTALVLVTAAEVNAAPVAVAGTDQNVVTGSVVTLDGSASSDANRDALTYAWTLNARPAGSAAVLSSGTSPKPTFTADVAGTYVASLLVSDGKLTSNVSVITVTVSSVNSAPVAVVGPNQSVLTSTLVTLDGSGSTDANRDALTYAWTLTAKPAGSAAVLSSTTVPRPTFTADVAGTYVASLVVNDGKLSSGLVATAITASAANAAPVAVAGADQNVVTATLVTLDGSASSDANRDPLTYAWTLNAKPAGSAAALSANTSARPTFTADLAGTYVASLVVSDGKASSNVAVVTVTASSVNSAPVAVVGANQSVLTATLVTLDGSGSTDANRDVLTYAWTLTAKPAGSVAVLSSATAARPTFTADLPGTYVASLVVNDGKVSSNVAATTVTASVANAAPVATVGANQNVVLASVVTLDGSASSDANRDPLTYAWTLNAKPAGSAAVLSSSASPRPTFTADVAGTYVASLVVNDGTVNSNVAVTTITATAANAAPVAVVGANQNVLVGASVTLDGRLSTDANRDPLTYAWTLMTKPAGSAASLSSASVAQPVFVADVAGTYVATLVVNDGQVNSSSVATTVTATVANAAPVANAGTNQTVPVSTTVTLDGRLSSDANGDVLTYSWSILYQPPTSTATLSSSSVSQPTLTPDLVGVYVLGLVVNDGKVNSALVTVSVTAQ